MPIYGPEALPRDIPQPSWTHFVCHSKAGMGNAAGLALSRGANRLVQIHLELSRVDTGPFWPMFCFPGCSGLFRKPNLFFFSHFVLFRVGASVVVCHVALIRLDVGLDGLLQAVQIALVLRIARLLECL